MGFIVTMQENILHWKLTNIQNAEDTQISFFIIIARKSRVSFTQFRGYNKKLNWMQIFLIGFRRSSKQT